MALFTDMGSAQTVVTVDLGRNLQSIVFDTSDVPSYQLSSGTIVGSSNANILVTSVVNQIETVTSHIQITGAMTLENDAVNTAAALKVSSPIASTGVSLVLTGSNLGNNIFSGPAAGVNVVKNGSGNWFFTGVANSITVHSGMLTAAGRYYGGPVAVQGGTFVLSGADIYYPAVISSGAAMTIKGGGFASGQSIAINGGTLTVDNSEASLARVAGDSITMASGTFNYAGGTGTNSETMSGLVLGSGANTLSAPANAASGSTLAFSTISRSFGATLLVAGNNLGNTPGPGVTSITATNGETSIGPGGDPGSYNVNIDPYIVAQDLAQTGNAQYGFTTELSIGLRTLNLSTEYDPQLPDPNSFPLPENVSLSTPQTTTNALELNSIRLDAGGSISGTAALTVDSGAVLALPGNGGIGAPLVFNSQEAVITTIGTLTLSGVVTGSGGVTKTGPGALVFGPTASASYTGQTTLNQGVLQFSAAGQAAPTSTVAFNGGALDVNGFNQAVGGVSGAVNVINSGGGQTTQGTDTPVAVSTLQLAGAGSQSTVTSLSIASNAALDLGGNSLIVDYGTGADPIAQIKAYILSGSDGGLWDGPGIVSSLAVANDHYAVGYADGADGVVAGLPAGEILIRPTIYGDINLDGVVNGTDLTAFGTHFGTNVAGWDQGDFNGDGAVNGTDLTLFGENFGMSVTGNLAQVAADRANLVELLTTSGFVSNVPEPSGAIFAGAGALHLLSLRIRRRKAA
jgi:autotransporter-associated beta strand protein